MSELPDGYREQLDLRAEIARIDRDRAETHKRQGETDKFVAEQRKLIAQAKLTRDRFLAPWRMIASLSGGIIVAVIGHFWK
jgi:hypothetical protein